MQSMLCRCAVVLCLVSSLTACQSPSTTATSSEGVDLPNLAADRVLYGVDHFSFADGVKRARLHADTSYVFANSDSVQMIGMNVDMFDEAGKPNGKVTAKAGSLNVRTREMFAKGNVVVVTQNGRRIMSEELFYNPQTHQVWSTKFTTIIEPNGTRQTTEGFRADDKFRNITGRNANLRGITF